MERRAEGESIASRRAQCAPEQGEEGRDTVTGWYLLPLWKREAPWPEISQPHERLMGFDHETECLLSEWPHEQGDVAGVPHQCSEGQPQASCFQKRGHSPAQMAEDLRRGFPEQEQNMTEDISEMVGVVQGTVLDRGGSAGP